MKYHHQQHALLITLSAALLAACSGGYEGAAYDETEGDEVADEAGDGVVLGTSWQALSYRTCTRPNSDPDGDGWGWEYRRPCVAPRSSTNSSNRGSTGTSCANHEGVASTAAAIAVSAAMEIKRWQPSRDFTIGRMGHEEALFLTAAAKSRCADGVCANTQALLDFQKNEANGKVVFPGGTKLNSPALRSRLVAKFREQQTCEARPANGGTANCPVEEHTLTFQRSEKGGCDTNYYFVAKRPDGGPLRYPGQLKNKLVWADPSNPYIGFQNVGEVVSIDPTYGLNEAGSTTSGSCASACTKISRSNVSGKCCTCGGSTKKFSRAPWNATTYICR